MNETARIQLNKEYTRLKKRYPQLKYIGDEDKSNCYKRFYAAEKELFSLIYFYEIGKSAVVVSVPKRKEGVCIK
ncbi:hypothetical protein [Bacillus altitudinis]|uniref:hypothetical protein n=1 Tax=Bacillus altitudinis TaxID=293387 RepID=UPI001C218F02|nr:hypothetical protein [Bacillus altitudinis]MBU8855194.1 hypothetical protein [Bacillus sp. FJAT-26377]MCY7454255.1 hypothetical protein [Bacillus altitudinis]